MALAGSLRRKRWPALGDGDGVRFDGSVDHRLATEMAFASTEALTIAWRRRWPSLGLGDGVIASMEASAVDGVGRFACFGGSVGR